MIMFGANTAFGSPVVSVKNNSIKNIQWLGTSDKSNIVDRVAV